MAWREVALAQEVWRGSPANCRVGDLFQIVVTIGRNVLGQDDGPQIAPDGWTTASHRSLAAICTNEREGESGWIGSTLHKKALYKKQSINHLERQNRLTWLCDISPDFLQNLNLRKIRRNSGSSVKHLTLYQLTVLYTGLSKGDIKSLHSVKMDVYI